MSSLPTLGTLPSFNPEAEREQIGDISNYTANALHAMREVTSLENAMSIHTLHEKAAYAETLRGILDEEFQSNLLEPDVHAEGVEAMEEVESVVSEAEHHMESLLQKVQQITLDRMEGLGRVKDRINAGTMIAKKIKAQEAIDAINKGIKDAIAKADSFLSNKESLYKAFMEKGREIQVATE
jgi:hypothetical protein